MPKCCVKSCRNNSLTKRKSHGISYFRFPQDEIQREKWRLLIKEERGDEYYKPNESSVVCSDHFTESDMYYTEKGYRRITKQAMPKIEIHVVPDQSFEYIDVLQSKPNASGVGIKSRLSKKSNPIIATSQESPALVPQFPQATDTVNGMILPITLTTIYNRTIRKLKRKLYLKCQLVRNLKRQNRRLKTKCTNFKQIIRKMKSDGQQLFTNKDSNLYV